MENARNKKHAANLLRWYDAHARVLPWRARPGTGAHPDPYHVWLSEIMLQQTVVKTVIPYFHVFLQNWPSIFDMAACEQEDILKRWAGLGYYARARNLHKCAQVVVAHHDGVFPREEKALLALPGIGPYTASAIRAIAFDKKATVVDGNVERVVARLYALKKPLREIKTTLKQKAAKLTPDKRPGDYAQAMMDLGATICTAKSPACHNCPISEHCLALEQDCAGALPARAAKKPKPVRKGTAFLVLREDGSVLLRQRHEKGLLAKMLEVPATRWCEKSAQGAKGGGEDACTPINADWQEIPGLVTHSFTHFDLQVKVRLAHVANHSILRARADPPRCRWVARDRLAGEALPGIMRKIISHGFGEPLSVVSVRKNK